MADRPIWHPCSTTRCRRLALCDRLPRAAFHRRHAIRRTAVLRAPSALGAHARPCRLDFRHDHTHRHLQDLSAGVLRRLQGADVAGTAAKCYLVARKLAVARELARASRITSASNFAATLCKSSGARCPASCALATACTARSARAAVYRAARELRGSAQKQGAPVCVRGRCERFGGHARASAVHIVATDAAIWRQLVQ